MKHLILLIMVLAIAPVAYAVGIDNTKHDLTYASNTYYTTGTSEICVFCHTPHNASPAVPLWNHAPATTTGWTMYTSTTLNNVPSAAPGGISLQCLSCHDGTVALGAVGNYKGTATTFAMAGTFGSLMTTAAALGKDLSNDHPISMTCTTDGSLTCPPARLFAGSKVECASCHNPHEYGAAADSQPFLTGSNANSAICLDCHDK